jgi:hypothetical protein
MVISTLAGCDSGVNFIFAAVSIHCARFSILKAQLGLELRGDATPNQNWAGERTAAHQ